MAAKDKERYETEKAEFIEGGGVFETRAKKPSKSKPSKPTDKASKKQSPVGSPAKSAPKSKETIDTDSDSD